jgi:hypothetical protein
MARDKKASFKFTTSTLSAPRLVSTATADKLSTAITYSAATTVAYQSVSDVFSSPNMILAAAADFASQADTAASGSSDLPGINGQGQSLFVKVIVSNNASVANAGSPMLQVFGSAASTVDAQGKVIKSAQDSYTDFSQYIKGLEQQSKTAKKVIGGSPSGERISSAEQAKELAGIAQSAASADVFGLAKAVGSTILARAKGISSESSAALQNKLFTTDPIEQRAILAELNRRAKAPRTGLLSGAAGVGTATGIIGD